MGSTFGTYSIAYSGMYVNQASLATTSTNLANVDTTGASKVQLSSAALTTAQSNGGTSTGDGVSVESIKRSRDIYLDSTYRTQNADATYLSVKSGDVEYMNEILSEYDTTNSSTSTTTSGVETAVDDFFNSWQTLATDSGSSSSSTSGTSAQTTLATAITTATSGTTSTNKTAVSTAYSAYASALTSGNAATIVSTKTTLDSAISTLADSTLTAALTTYNTSAGTAITTNATALSADITAGATAQSTLASAITTATSGSTTAEAAVSTAYSAYTTALTNGNAATIISTKATLDSTITTLANATLTSAYSTYNSAADGGTAINTAAAALTTALSTATSTTTAGTTRAAVTAAAADLITTLTGMDEALQQLQSDAVSEVKDGVTSLNSLSGKVADLDQQITQAEAGGGQASYLEDQRDELLDQMSSLADISSTIDSNGNCKVTLNGATLVDGNTTQTLVVKGSGTTDNPLTVNWANSNTQAVIKSGSIKAYMEDADQTGYAAIDSSTLPYNFTTTATSSISTLRQGLNDLITTLADKVNSLSTSGVDLDGNAGVDFFTAVDASQPLSITNIQVNPALTADSSKVVAASSDAAGDNTIANDVCALASDATCYKSSNSSLDINDFYSSLTDWIGTTGDTAASDYSTQSTLVAQVDTQRQSVSSISLDEEMSNMIKFQTAYAASAKVMSTIDSMLSTLITGFES